MPSPAAPPKRRRRLPKSAKKDAGQEDAGKEAAKKEPAKEAAGQTRRRGQARHGKGQERPLPHRGQAGGRLRGPEHDRTLPAAGGMERAERAEGRRARRHGEAGRPGAGAGLGKDRPGHRRPGSGLAACRLVAEGCGRDAAGPGEVGAVGHGGGRSRQPRCPGGLEAVLRRGVSAVAEDGRHGAGSGQGHGGIRRGRVAAARKDVQGRRGHEGDRADRAEAGPRHA